MLHDKDKPGSAAAAIVIILHENDFAALYGQSFLDYKH
jgi:hypothetical protein